MSPKTDEIELVIDGAGVSPDTIDPFQALDLCRSYLELLRKIGQEGEEELPLVGFEVREHSFGAATRTSNPEAAKHYVHRAARLVADVDPPSPTLDGAVRKFRTALGHLPVHWHARTEVAGETVPLVAVAPDQGEMIRETIDIRARLTGAWGMKKHVAEFVARAEERPFTLRVELADVKRLAAHLFEEVDLFATVVRDGKGHIHTGELEDFTPVQDGDALAAWREWFKSAGAGWEDVEDIEKELGRDR